MKVVSEIVEVREMTEEVKNKKGKDLREKIKGLREEFTKKLKKGSR